MKPVAFPEQNVVYAEEQPPYQPLPAHRSGGVGVVTSCWAMTLRDRLVILLTGRVWVRVLSFNKPLQPQIVSARKHPRWFA